MFPTYYESTVTMVGRWLPLPASRLRGLVSAETGGEYKHRLDTEAPLDDQRDLFLASQVYRAHKYHWISGYIYSVYII